MKHSRLALSFVLACTTVSQLLPSTASARPPAPEVGTLGTIITSSYIDRCLRRAERCRLDDRFEQTLPLEVRPHIRLIVDTHARARRLRAALDCRHRDPLRLSRRFWAIRIKAPNGRPRGGRMCTAGSLVIDYAEGRTTRARYTFSTTEDPRVRRCRPDGWEFILENDVARVYSVLESGEPAYYVCRFETGRVRWFGRDHTGDTAYDPNESVDVAGTRLADRKLAYVLIETDSRYEPRQHHRLVVRDFVSWEIEHEIEGGHHWRGGVDFGAPGDEYGITDVELEDDGAVGWIVAKGPEGGYRPFEVRKADATGSDVLLDSGTDIDPESLTLEGSTLRWLHAGEPRSASLD